MNDLRDIQWQASSSTTERQQAIHSGANYNPIYQRQNNPFSQKSQVISLNNNGAAQKPVPPSSMGKGKPVEPGSNLSDSFGGLVDFGASRKVDLNHLSLAQRAASLESKKVEQGQAIDSHFANASFFEAQLSRPSSTAPTTQWPHEQTFARLKKSDTESSQDILDQINGNRPVDNSSFYPPPSSSPSRSFANSLNIQEPRSYSIPAQEADPWDVLPSFKADAVRTDMADDDDDILGALGKPVTTSSSSAQFAPSSATRAVIGNIPSRQSFTSSSDEQESSEDEDVRRAKAASLLHVANSTNQPSATAQTSAVKQLVEMGYTKMQAQVALAQTDTGYDLAAAIDLLLSLETLGGKNSSTELESTVARSTQNFAEDHSPRKRQGRAQNESGDWVDTTYDLASKTLASANSWLSNKSALARRKLAEFNAETAAETHASRFDERPKWMRDAEKHERKDKGKARAREDEEDDPIREEGLPMHPSERRRLELNGVLPTSPRRGSVDSEKSAKSLTGSIRSIPDSFRSLGTSLTGGLQSPVYSANSARTAKNIDSRRYKADDEEASAYTSSRRRRPASNKPLVSTNGQPQALSSAIVPSSRSEPLEEDLFGAVKNGNKDKGKGKAQALDVEDDLFGAPVVSGSRTTTYSEKSPEVDLFSPAPLVQQSRPISTNVSRSKAVLAQRQTPYLDATFLAASSKQRLRGSEFFKKGDFANALSCYQTSLVDIPAGHPIRILSLTNRAITQIQLGAPKPAAADCEEALQIIGAQNGIGEVIEDAGKQVEMSGLWVKAMTRKATALEMQERNTDALSVWQELVKSGLGGAQAVQARQRCENVLAPKKIIPVKAPSQSSKPSQASQAAIKKLREDEAKSAEAESQRDSLYAVVDTRITSWSTGKESNLRALLSSLDQVLWPSSGWKKVTLADLVINAKVKVIYMKALAKVHPDKISRDASVEEKMIAAGVFAKLNGAWDSFKAQNNM